MAELVEQGVARVAEKLRATAPEGWTEAVQVSAQGLFGLGISTEYAIPGVEPQPLHATQVIELAGTFQDLKDVTAAVGAARGWERTRLEIRCRPSGEFDLLATRETVFRQYEHPGFLAVLDHDYRLPVPGFAQEEGTAAPTGDPDLAVARFRAYLERRADILGRPEKLPPPVTTTALDDAERRLGRPLPADLRALYLIADGSGDEAPDLFGDLRWLPLERLAAANEHDRDADWSGWESSWNSVVLDADPLDTVRRCRQHPGWLPFATADDGNCLAVDMSPAPAGRPGQVIQYGDDYDDGPRYVCDSVTALLARYLELLEQGAYEVEEDVVGQLEFTEDPREPGFDPELRIDGVPLDVPPGLQAVLIHSDGPAGALDLAPFTAAPHLRRLELGRRPVADLSPLRALPVESLGVTLHGGDLAPLEGHRYLTSLGLATSAPIDITPLRTIPNLRCLDLSQAEVRDLTALADFPDLRYLALTGSQWAALLDQGELPPTLAAARLAEADASRCEALSWAERLGLAAGEPFSVTGTLGLDGE
ncbi:SMI1/KNR4 family protein [Kitasatospora sp. NPDC097643]|uniref:SMI1/KNR4 family protein n=1 Tax=Kitasatospora sp. NPDC097643 TaxID=3157230 RepID=UPI00332F9C3A